MIFTIRCHPDTAFLMSFAAGSSPEPLAAVVSAHASMCAQCREELCNMELIGTGLLMALPALTVDDRKMSIPNRPTVTRRVDGAGRGNSVTGMLPSPIAQKYGLTFENIPWKAWKRFGTGFWYHRLALSTGVEGDLRLVKVAAGCHLPLHGHSRTEFTLVLDGAYTDDTDEYRRGNVQGSDEDMRHQPVADKELGCILLNASD